MPDWLIFVAPLLAASLVLLFAFAGCRLTHGQISLDDLVFYEPPSGQGEFWKTDGQGGIAQIGETHTDWRTSWRLIKNGVFGGGAQLLFYDRTAGEGEFWSVSGGGMSLVGPTNTGWRTDWTTIVPGKFAEGPHTDLLFYEQSTGQGEFWRSNGDGTISLIGETNFGWRTSWQIIVPGNFADGPYTDLLFYDRAAGEGEFWKTGGDGGIAMIGETNTGWRDTWRIIVPGNFADGDYTDLLFYDRAAGQGEFWKTGGDGGIGMIGETNTDWRPSWAQIVPGYFGDQSHYTDLLFYDARGGTGEFWFTDGDGVVNQIGASHTDWRSDWFIITTGSFG